MRTLLRRDFKYILYHDKNFREFFPEYKSLFYDLDSGKIKRSCCGFSESTYQRCIQLVIGNPIKWKKFLGTDEIQMYFSKDGKPKRSHIL